MSDALVLAVDGGNSKTDLALVRADGEVLALVRGPLSSPHHLGLDGAVGVVDELLEQALAESGVARRNGNVAAVGELLLAGVDFPAEEQDVLDVVTDRGWAQRVFVRNDTFAVLRAGTEQGWGIAIVCGTGINCVGVAPDGRHARFPALGSITGDWGGGYDVGVAAVSAAARSEDGRGPATSLEQAVPRYFELAAPHELAEAIHRGRIPMARLRELAPTVLAKAADDQVAAEIVDRLAAEVVAFARVALTRLGLAGDPVEVLLGGGLLQRPTARLLAAIEDGLREVGPSLLVRTTESHPIVGAALLGLDHLGADDEARARVRRELGESVTRFDARSAVGG